MWLKKTVVMIGMMGAGKTAVGMALARELAVPFLDSDEEIVRAADRSIAEIFERDGEPFFRTRPLLRTANPRETLRGLYEARGPIYALADLIVDSEPDLPVESMAQRVVQALLTRPDVLVPDELESSVR